MPRQIIDKRIYSIHPAAFLFLFMLTIGKQVSAQFKTEINNKKTKEYTQLPGTHLFFILDKNDSILDGLPALMLNDFASIQVMDLDGGNFESNNRNMTIANFESKGMHVLDSSTLKVNAYDALCFHVEQQGMKSVMLSFGDKTFSTLVMGIYFSEDPEVFSELITVMSSVVYDKKVTTFTEADLPFYVITEGTPYKFAKAIGNMFLYSINGEEKPKENDSFFSIMSTPYSADFPPRQYLNNNRETLEREGVSNLTLLSDKQSVSMGNEIYERIYEGTKSGETYRYQNYIIFNETQVVYFMGVAKNDLEQTTEEFRNITRTIVLR